MQGRPELDLIFTKSGIIVGLGQTRNEVLQPMDDLRTAEVEFLTIAKLRTARMAAQRSA